MYVQISNWPVTKIFIDLSRFRMDFYGIQMVDRIVNSYIHMDKWKKYLFKSVFTRAIYILRVGK